MIYQLPNGYWVRPMVPADLDGQYARWFEDQEVCRYNSHGKFFPTRPALVQYLEGTGDNRLLWAICDARGSHVGNITLQRISLVDRSAEFAILLGERDHWGQGLGKNAGVALLLHGFEKVNLHRIYCGTAANNTGMISLARSLGMREEGRRREALFLEGAWVDTLEFGVLRREFREMNEKKPT